MPIFVLGGGGAGPAGPESQTLALRGRLSVDLTYAARIDYATTVNARACQQDDYITGMLIPLADSRYVTPTVAGERHELSAPLAKPGADPACGWRPKAVYLCVGPRDAGPPRDHCSLLFLMRADAPAPRPALALACAKACTLAGGGDPRQEVGGLPSPVQLDLLSAPGR